MRCAVAALIAFCLLSEYIENTEARKCPQSFLKEITIPIKIHYERHNKNTKPTDEYQASILSITNTLIEDVEELLNKPGLGVKIKLKLLKTTFVLAKSWAKRKSLDMEDYLARYCKWQRTYKKKEEPYLSILLVNPQNKVLGAKHKIGISRLSGACTRDMSCTIIRRNPLLDLTIAHEISHTIGLLDRPSCENKHQYLMKAKFNENEYNVDYWSMCSKCDLHRFLRSKKAKCFIPEKAKLLLRVLSNSVIDS